MTNTTQTLDLLARALVGDGTYPNLAFVSQYDREGGGVKAVFVLDESEEEPFAAACAFAQSLPGRVVIEDRLTGVVWENEESLKLQRAED